MSPSNNRNHTRSTPVSSIDTIDAADVIVGDWVFGLLLVDSFGLRGLEIGLEFPDIRACVPPNE